MDTPPTIQPERQPDWWDRNWKWFLPTVILGVLAVTVVALFALFSVIFGFMKSSEPYQIGLVEAQKSPALIAQIGEPIEAGWFATGNLNYSGSSGDADLAIPVHGPKGKATVYILAKREAGEWHMHRAEVEVKGSGERIDLLKEL